MYYSHILKVIVTVLCPIKDVMFSFLEKINRYYIQLHFLSLYSLLLQFILFFSTIIYSISFFSLHDTIQHPKISHVIHQVYHLIQGKGSRKHLTSSNIHNQNILCTFKITKCRNPIDMDQIVIIIFVVIDLFRC